jgi:hypothetical protein
MGERIFTLEILGNSYELPVIVPGLPCLALFSERAAK